jgi:hypothetical protein
LPASIFITAHDGFTLRDLVSYNGKHNDANGEHNRDGDDHNRSWNCGVEGDTDDEAVLALRSRQQRNYLATLLLSQGVPMLLGGDEIGRSQAGNNNAYCQDNLVSWFDWEHADHDLFRFTAKLIALRRSHPVLRRRRFFLGRPIHGQGIGDIVWFRPDGEEMTEDDWNTGFAKSFAVFLNGDALHDLDERNERTVDDDFLLLFNPHYETVEFRIPPSLPGDSWFEADETTEDKAISVAAAPLTLRFPLPRREQQRVAALHRLNVLDTPPEEPFDDIATLASQICATPIAAVSFVDSDRQWFKSRIGLRVEETPRDVAFCTHAILGAEVFEVPDAAADDRFAANPLATQDPKIRFYAGAPIATRDGLALGTVCVIDRKPRTLTAAQREALAALSRQVAAQLELRRLSARNGGDTLPRSADFGSGDIIEVGERSLLVLQSGRGGRTEPPESG